MLAIHKRYETTVSFKRKETVEDKQSFGVEKRVVMHKEQFVKSQENTGPTQRVL